MENFFRESGVKWLWGRIKTLLSTKQDKLVSGSNIKTINGTSVLGAGNITIEGGDSTGVVDEGRLVWSTNDIQNDVTIMDSMFRDTIGNRLAFCDPAAITIEHSQDGGNTWVSIDNDADKIKLVTPVLGDISFTIGGSETPSNRDAVQTRVTIDAITADLYFVVNKILIKTIYVTNVDSATGKPTYCRIEYQTYGNYGTDTWTTYKDIEVIGQPGWNSISTNGLPYFGYANPPYIRLIRFTLYKPNGCGQYIGRLSNIAFLALGISQGGNTFSKTGHIYGIDVNQNVTFPANIKASDFNGVNISVNNNIKGKTLNIGTGATLSNSGTATIGASCSATNYYAIAMGYQAVSSGYYSTAIGTNVKASADYQTVIGKNNASSTHAFVIGWGTADAKKNIFSVDTSGNVYGTKFITKGGTNQQVVLGDGSLKALSEISKSYSVVTTSADGLMPKGMYAALKDGFIANIVEVTTNGNSVELSYNAAYPNADGTFNIAEDEGVEIPLATTTTAGVMSAADKVLLGTHTTKIASAEDNINGLKTRVTALENSSDNTDSRYTQFIDVLNDSNAAPIIPSENFFNYATWADNPEDNEATLDFMNEDAKTLFYDGEKWVEGGMSAAALHIPYANNTTSGLMSADDKIKLDGFDGFNTAKDYVGADVANGVYGRGNYINLSNKGLNAGDIIIVTCKSGSYMAYAMLMWLNDGFVVIKNENTPSTTISTQHPYIIFSSVQATDEITIRKIHTTRL
jgi:hypothetical protein